MKLVIMSVTENPKKEAAYVGYLCTKDKVERKKIIDIKRTDKTALIEIHMATANERIKKCDDKKTKENREVIAKKGETVTFFKWHGDVFIKGVNKIVFERSWDKIAPHLSNPLTKMGTFDLYEAKIEGTKTITGFDFGVKLDRRSEFIVWTADDSIFNSINRNSNDADDRIEIPDSNFDTLSLQIPSSQSPVQRDAEGECGSEEGEKNILEKL